MNRFYKGLLVFLFVIAMVFTFCACIQEQEEPEVGLNLPNKSLNLITAGPGEDASTSVVISWHSKYLNSVLEYKAEGESNYTVQKVKGVQSTSPWTEDVSFYRNRVVLTGLTPNTTYNYRVKSSDGTVSDEARFRTAGTDTTFQFMWLSDNHVPKGGSNTLKRVKELIAFANVKSGVDIDFCLFTGDMVNKGQIYAHWDYWADSKLLNNLEYAFVAGNHDYYAYNSKVRTTNAYFKDVAAYPYNNTQGTASVLDSNYWFIWNRVLFVCVDNFTSEGTMLSGSGRSVSDQIKWFKAVVNANAGNYDYLVYAQHLPFFNTDTAPCEYGYYTNWNKVFDEYKVDFALSSDEHTYRRTYPLYNDAKVELVGGKVETGTVYVTSNMTEGSSISSVVNEAAPDLQYVAYTAGGVGGVYFTVTPTEMTLHLIGKNGVEYDTITVLKKDRSN